MLLEIAQCVAASGTGAIAFLLAVRPLAGGAMACGAAGYAIMCRELPAAQRGRVSAWQESQAPPAAPSDWRCRG